MLFETTLYRSFRTQIAFIMFKSEMRKRTTHFVSYDVSYKVMTASYCCQMTNAKYHLFKCNGRNMVYIFYALRVPDF